MESVKVSKSFSSGQLGSKTVTECFNLCGICPSCVFALKPSSSSKSLWRVSDEFKRSFLVKLLLRCRNVQVLESVQSALCVTSWTLFTYGRCRGSTPPQDHFCSHRELDGKPADINEIWSWFDSSPDWIKSSYLCHIFSRCDAELLRMISNLSSVLLVRHKRGFLQFNGSRNISSHDVDSEDPALMVVPGSSKSVSGVSLYRDFIGCLPVHLSKRILGLLEEDTLRCCRMVCRYWQHLAQQTMEEVKFRKNIQNQILSTMKRRRNVVSCTYANIVDVLVPVKDDDPEDFHSTTEQKERPFKAAYAKIKTKTLQMEERNVYCGAYFTKVLLSKKDPHRVLDYRGGSLMATGSKDSLVNLLYVASETTKVATMRGHVGSIRAVLLCEDRDLVITGSRDASIRCWNLKTDKCEMTFYGHTDAISCLDLHAGRLASGSRDYLVKVWCLDTGKQFKDFNFKHVSPVQCVKISKTTVCSSCVRGQVKLWSMENTSLHRVITAHRSPVKCLFFDEWHLLSGDSSGKVMAWSTNCDEKDLCLMTFNHPKEVSSLTLVYLRVVTGCVDGKIRIFNFLTGDCLREITAEAETGRILSLHFNDNSILVNSATSVKLYQFAKVFWDYADSPPGDRGVVATRNGLVSEKSPALIRRIPFTSKDTAQVSSLNHKIHSCRSRKPGRTELLYQTCLPTKCQTQTRVSCEAVKPSVRLSEKAARERMKKRGPHHPLTRDYILLRVNAVQKAQCMDDVGINMERNARLRDSWGPQTPQDPLKPQHTGQGRHREVKTCIPTTKQTVSQHMTARNVSTAPATMRKHQPPIQPHRPIKTVDGLIKSASVALQTLDCMRSLSNPKPCSSLPWINPFNKQGRSRLLTATHYKDSVQTRREVLQRSEQKLSRETR
ncbi:F-box/WD repeat-containing protein 10 isoform X1 [Acanthochromis polyacanthus]|uniref:F-box/WD repeat-containing protein 10 isoform X1 n=2 Tax=Acanthochromis polyacanthus TaxID=80966 RepID=UPI002233F0D2|nr:F-box/WD repeat-containing protein 10 isoform X1 [Acanthochromis polyacanthus]